MRSRRREDLKLEIEEGRLLIAVAHLGNVSWMLGEVVEPGTRPSLAADDPRVRQTLESFVTHLAANGVNFAETKLPLGRTLSIDPATGRSDDTVAKRRLSREYRKGYELPRV